MLKRLPTTFGCPVELTLEVLGGKWKPVILAHLKDGALRYGELRARIPNLSDKVLTERLRDLEDRGLVARQSTRESATRESATRKAATRGAPRERPQVVYHLTKRGNSLRPVLTALYAWGEDAAPELGVTVKLLDG